MFRAVRLPLVIAGLRKAGELIRARHGDLREIEEKVDARMIGP